MKKAFEIFVEIIFRLALFASPFLFTVAIGILIYISDESLAWLSIIVLATGFLAGILLAEKIRRKYGCTNYVSGILR